MLSYFWLMSFYRKVLRNKELLFNFHDTSICIPSSWCSKIFCGRVMLFSILLYDYYTTKITWQWKSTFELTKACKKKLRVIRLTCRSYSNLLNNIFICGLWNLTVALMGIAERKTAFGWKRGRVLILCMSRCERLELEQHCGRKYRGCLMQWRYWLWRMERIGMGYYTLDVYKFVIFLKTMMWKSTWLQN